MARYFFQLSPPDLIRWSMLGCSQAAPVEALHKRDLCMDCRVKPGNDERNERERTKIKFGGETPTDANVIMPCRRARPRLLRKAHDCRRSTAALAKGTFVVFGATSGQASWDVANRFGLSVEWALPTPACP